MPDIGFELYGFLISVTVNENVVPADLVPLIAFDKVRVLLDRVQVKPENKLPVLSVQVGVPDIIDSQLFELESFGFQ
jgi:hypothetical protein